MTAEEVLHRMEIFSRALQHHDFAAIGTIYSDRYMLVRPDGTLLNKEQVLKDLIEHKMAFHPIELKDASVRLLGSAAILTGKTTILRPAMEITPSDMFDSLPYTLRNSRRSDPSTFRPPRFLTRCLRLKRCS